MYRTRLGKRLDGSIAAYVSSISDDSAIVDYDIRGSIAHVIMLKDSKLVSSHDASRILRALLRINTKSLSASNDAEDIHELIESRVVSSAGNAGRRMHTARSRNDQVALDIRMKLRDDINKICELATELVSVMLGVASKHTKTVMPLYTHLQQAQYGTLSHYMIAYADALLRDIDRFGLAYTHINQSPLGASAIGGTSLRIDRSKTARLLGFEKIVENSIDATSSRDHVAEYVSAVAIMMTGLSRIAEDLVIWSTSEFSFIELGDAISSPSSAMPQKMNPDVLEITRAKAADTIGQLVSVLGATKGLATGYGRDLQQARVPVWSASQTAIGALDAMCTVISGMKINTRRMQEVANLGYLDALEVVEVLVSDNDVAFRDAHGIVARLIRAAYGQNIRLDALSNSQLRAALGNGSGVSLDAVRRAIAQSTAQKSLQRRRSIGSAGFAEQSRMVSKRKRMVKTIKRIVERRRLKVKGSFDALEKKACSMSSKKS